MSTYKLSIISLSIATITGCYGSAPGKPPTIPVPAVQPGAQITVHSETKTTMESVQKQARSCPDGHPEACTTTTYSEMEPITRTTSTASLDNEPINYAQFVVITDSKRDEKLSALDDLSTHCQHANIPRYAGLGLMLGGLVAGIIVGGDAGKGIVYGGLGAGAGAYALGYFAFGGRDCVEAQDLYNELDVSDKVSWQTVHGAEYANEMKTLAEQFNAAHNGDHAGAEPMRMRK